MRDGNVLAFTKVLRFNWKCSFHISRSTGLLCYSNQIGQLLICSRKRECFFHFIASSWRLTQKWCFEIDQFASGFRGDFSTKIHFTLNISTVATKFLALLPGRWKLHPPCFLPAHLLTFLPSHPLPICSSLFHRLMHLHFALCNRL